jgi:hypothetical protein
MDASASTTCRSVLGSVAQRRASASVREQRARHLRTSRRRSPLARLPRATPSRHPWRWSQWAMRAAAPSTLPATSGGSAPQPVWREALSAPRADLRLPHAR